MIPFGGLLGDNSGRESPSDMSCVLKSSLGEAVRGSDIIVVERNLLCDLRTPEST